MKERISSEDKLHLMGLSMVKQLGPVTVRNLLAYFGEPQQVFKARRGELVKIPGIGKKTAQLILTAHTLHKAEGELTFCEKNNIQIITYLDKRYPQKLKEIFQAPLVLYARGNGDISQMPSISIVGTRKPTDYGKRLAREFAREFAAYGINVVSGLAYGIDIEAHREVLEASGVTTAVLGHGLDRIYPARHIDVARGIMEKGLLLSEYSSGVKPEAGNFPARNRIISGLSNGTLVIEAGESGGALITAKFAFEQNREVYAIPGRPDRATSIGCNALIRDNIAKLVGSPEDIVKDIASKVPGLGGKEVGVPKHPLTAQERRIFSCLNKQGPLNLDEISNYSRMAFGEVSSLLLGMEFKGAVRPAPGNKFVVG